MQPNVHISRMTTLPRKSARRRGESTFSQTSLVNSGAGPRSGNEATIGMVEFVCCLISFPNAHPKRMKAVNPRRKRFIVSLLDGSILKNLPYKKITIALIDPKGFKEYKK